MFKDDYSAQMNAVSPDEATKAAILSELKEGGRRAEQKKQMRRSRNLWRAGFAVAAAAALVLSAILLPRSRTTPRAVTMTVTKAAGYGEIYDRIAEIEKAIEAENRVSLFGWLTGSTKNSVATTDEAETIVEEYAYELDDGALNGSAPAAAGGTAADENRSENADYSDSTDDGTEDFSETNTQVEGVAEADIVRTDGRYIYALSGNTLRIVRAEAGAPVLAAQIDLGLTQNESCNDFYLTENRIVAVAQCWDVQSGGTYRSGTLYDTAYSPYGESRVLIYDVSDPENPQKTGECTQSGSLVDSRMIGGSLYLITSHAVTIRGIRSDEPETFVPSVECRGKRCAVPADSICLYDGKDFSAIYTVAGVYNTADGTLADTASLLGGSSTVYCSTESLLTALGDYDDAGSFTVISYFAIGADRVEYRESARIEGNLLNQFSMDEYKEHFRFVTTVDHITETTVQEGQSTWVSSRSYTDVSLTVLDRSMKTVGSLSELAAGERVYSVRFMGDTAYFVTFRQTDPLFSVDLSDPTKPTVLGALKIPGFSNYLFPYGDGRLLGIGMDAAEATGRTECMKLSMFDISDPANVTEYDKLRLEGTDYSPALYNHKASLVDAEKNLIGFSTESITSRGSCLFSYQLFCYDEAGFRPIAAIELEKDEFEARGLFIGNVFYLVSDTRVQTYRLDDFTPLGTLRF